MHLVPEARVPTISRFVGITIAMYFDDHGFPHFHARHNGGEAKVRIGNLEVIESGLGVANCDSSATESFG